MEAGEFNDGTLFAYVATEAAYTYGAEWLQQMRAYVMDNIRFVDAYLQGHIPQIKVYLPQASFLIWGSMFGPGGEGFMRMNVGCPRSVLVTALEALKKAIDKA